MPQSPLDPVDQTLNVLGFFGGFPLVQDTQPQDLPAFYWKPNICRTIWIFILNILFFASPLVTFLIILYINDYPGINILFPYAENDSAIWRLSGLLVSDIVTHYVSILFSLLCTLINVILLSSISQPLTELCVEMGSILLHTTTSDQIKSVTSAAMWRHLGWFFLSILVFPFSFYIVYVRIPDSLPEGSRISAAFVAAGMPLYFLFSIPAISTYLMIDQIYGTLSVMLKNLGTQLIPPARNGRLIRTAPGAYNQPNNQIDFNRGPPVMQIGSKSIVPSLIVISDAETMIGYGNAFASMVEKANQTFGSLLCLEAVFCFVMSVIHFYLFTPIVTVTRLWDPEQLAFLLCFCIGNLLSGICFQFRLSVLSGHGYQISENMSEAKQNLRELTILKFKKLTAMEMFELTALRERMEETAHVKPLGYFKLDRTTLIASRALIVAYIILLMGAR